MSMKATIPNDLAVVQCFHEEKNQWWKKWKHVTSTLRRDTEIVCMQFITRVKWMKMEGEVCVMYAFLFFNWQQLNVSIFQIRPRWGQAKSSLAYSHMYMWVL